MSSVRDLPENLQSRINGRDLIVFDGECVLCSRFFQFVLKRDRARRFYFATAQSELGQDLYCALGLPADDFETILVVVGGKISQRFDAILATLVALRGVWSGFAPFSRLPNLIKDPIYWSIARRRYRIFGRSKTCMAPSDDVRARSLSW